MQPLNVPKIPSKKVSFLGVGLLTEENAEALAIKNRGAPQRLPQTAILASFGTARANCNIA
jgi:hypothetical protein